MAATGLDLILKSKQHGFSVLLLLFDYFMASTNANWLGVHISRDTDQNQFFLDTIKAVHRDSYECEWWQRPRVGYDNRREFTFPHLNSSIRVLPPKRGAGRGFPLSFAHLSEVPWWNMADTRRKEIIVGVLESRRPEGCCVVESTPAMIGDVFGRLWYGTDDLAPYFTGKHRYGWAYKWTPEEAAERRAMLGARLFAREHGCDFTQSGDAVYEIVPPIAPVAERSTGADDARRFWTGVDPAGGGEDKTVIRVIDPSTGRGYHECGRWPYSDAAARLKRINEWYPPSPKPLVERAGGYGDAFVQACREQGVGVARGPDGKPGFPMNSRTKPGTVRRLDEAFREGSVYLVAECERQEVLEYAYLAEGKTGAPHGRHDDHEAALRMAWMAGHMRRPRISSVALDDKSENARRHSVPAMFDDPMTRILREC